MPVPKVDGLYFIRDWQMEDEGCEMTMAKEVDPDKIDSFVEVLDQGEVQVHDFCEDEVGWVLEDGFSMLDVIQKSASSFFEL